MGSRDYEMEDAVKAAIDEVKSAEAGD